ncbi:hypothetical protein [Ensifer canadensis]
MAKDDLTAGFTGTPIEPPTGVRKAAKTASDAVKRETHAVALAAADHPHTATGLVLAIGALAFAIGFVMGRSSIENERGYWR